MTPSQRLSAIRSELARLSPTHLEIEDHSEEHAGHKSAGGAGHFSVRIASPHFSGKSRLQQHRLIYQTLAALMEREIHALSIEIIEQKQQTISTISTNQPHPEWPLPTTRRDPASTPDPPHR